MLLGQESHIFRTSDLAVLWGIMNKNTLLTTIRRYVQREILYPIQKGMYATIPLNKLHPYELGCALAGSSSYVSTETVLQTEGIIMQQVQTITLFGAKAMSKTVGSGSYLVRYLHPKYLLNRTGIVEKSIYAVASIERAIADMLYIEPTYYFDNEKATSAAQVVKLSKEIGYS